MLWKDGSALGARISLDSVYYREYARMETNNPLLNFIRVA